FTDDTAMGDDPGQARIHCSAAPSFEQFGFEHEIGMILGQPVQHHFQSWVHRRGLSAAPISGKGAVWNAGCCFSLSTRPRLLPTARARRGSARNCPAWTKAGNSGKR